MSLIFIANSQSFICTEFAYIELLIEKVRAEFTLIHLTFFFLHISSFQLWWTPWLFHTWLFPSEFSYWTDFFLFFFFNLETLLMRTTKPHRLIININRLQVYFIRSVLWAVMVSGVLCHMTLQIRWGNNYLIICWICKVAHFQRNYIFFMDRDKISTTQKHHIT